MTVSAATAATAAENELASVSNAEVYSTDQALAYEAFLAGYFDDDLPSVTDAAVTAAMPSDSGGAGDGGFGTAMAADAATENDSAWLETLVSVTVASADGGAAAEGWVLQPFGAESGAPADDAIGSAYDDDFATEEDAPFLETITSLVVASADSGAGLEAALIQPLGSDAGSGVDPGGGGFNSVVSTATFLAADAAAFLGGWLAELLGADSGLGDELGVPGLVGTFGYYVYSNAGSGPINYNVAIATIYGFTLTTWTSTPLSYPDTWMFGVRAFNEYGIEQNLDCEVTIVLDASGNDITQRPLPPQHLRAFPTAAGGIRVEWAYNTISPDPIPTGFHVYAGNGGSPSYTSPVATVSFFSAIAGTFVANIGPYTPGIVYTIGVRAYNGVAEEPNTNTVSCTPISSGPSAVVGLSGAAIV